jgi:hypothetical protein
MAGPTGYSKRRPFIIFVSPSLHEKALNKKGEIAWNLVKKVQSREA